VRGVGAHARDAKEVEELVEPGLRRSVQGGGV
jgi:hypothetical protein